jgi:predicted O-methyltransferase YrrM
MAGLPEDALTAPAASTSVIPWPEAEPPTYLRICPLPASQSWKDLHMTRGPVPMPVARAQAGAVAAGFEHSCSDGTGWLLHTLAASLHDDAVIGESGTGYGVGSAWLLSGSAGSRLVTVELDEGRARSAGELLDREFGDRACVLHDNWTALSDHAPFALLFCDGGGKVQNPQAVIDLVAPGGWLVLDDFTPSSNWPPLFHGQLDETRWAYLSSPLLTSTSVEVSPTESALVAVRRLL